MKCSKCKQEIEECDFCQSELKEGQEILCWQGNNHFCMLIHLQQFLEHYNMLSDAHVESAQGDKQ